MSDKEKQVTQESDAEETLKEKKVPKQPKASIGEDTFEEKVRRRSFISWLTVAWITFTAATGAFFTMMMRFMFPNVLFEPPQSFKIGYPDEYKVGEVDLRWKNKHGIWVVRNSEQIYALSTVCTHLGCMPNWLENEQKFKCPCHGSGFRMTGINFEGPAPRPLERFKIVLADDGQMLIDKTKKYQYEKGQWSNPESFLVV
ncbi:MAG: ubiquinol-cytochrome c reductase iron-sulfur subunit [Candidatus Marinimicrobia bacterium]|jgi:cytochrome b6-f complex iron-sulfur subunit|nr:Rieske (2Fe-2S) protein [Candidatus Neomarinimicrobiota bacterium]MDP6457167.1 ubiquinol-cytochrome c reductase iron-sulfur subunit [Candidatus Neomarinimicrobiota bacterium]MDP6593589.1 ubiquinol-cytochrome c reductase iron-sulfur subunit [Candidatus Neomarinimicrobiota bacterium]MDP6836260.1 ubiquinol-cytochrome c reductase iron-sulfur subunit [Candidatus Neomarinimicrobiota bacterium]